MTVEAKGAIEWQVITVFESWQSHNSHILAHKRVILDGCASAAKPLAAQLAHTLAFHTQGRLAVVAPLKHCVNHNATAHH